MAKAAGSTIFLLALLATTLSTHAQNVDLKSELVALVSSEIAFSKAAADSGIRAAFLDDSARLYGFHISAPLAGKPAVLASQAVKAAVSWQPMNAVVSRGDDLGCTYGQLENGGNALSGYYTHFWKRDAAGAWKIVLEVLSPAGRKN